MIVIDRSRGLNLSLLPLCRDIHCLVAVRIDDGPDDEEEERSSRRKVYNAAAVGELVALANWVIRMSTAQQQYSLTLCR